MGPWPWWSLHNAFAIGASTPSAPSRHHACTGAQDAIRFGETFAFDPLILARVSGGGLMLDDVAR